MYYVIMLADKAKRLPPIYVSIDEKKQAKWSSTFTQAMYFHSEMEVMQVLNWLAISAPLFEDPELFNRVNGFAVSWYKTILPLIPEKYKKQTEFVIGEISVRPMARFPLEKEKTR